MRIVRVLDRGKDTAAAVKVVDSNKVSTNTIDLLPMGNTLFCFCFSSF